jgi:hypothetical protein
MRPHPWPILLLVAALLYGGPAQAQESPPTERVTGDRINNWKIGSLAYTGSGLQESTVSDLQSKIRIGSSLLPGEEEHVSIRPWIGFGATSVDGTVQSMGGLLMDVPVGDFVFTPSIGASMLPSAARENGNTVQFRSQLELGYEFDDQSRFSLAYSRVSAGRIISGDGGSNKVIGLYYRMPFSALAGD